MRWRSYWGGLGQLTLSAFEGNAGLISTQVNDCETIGTVNEGIDIADSGLNVFGLQKILIEQESSSPALFNEINGCVSFQLCNKSYIASARKVEFKPESDGGTIIVEAWILK